ncbi:MAG: hypothetical protein ACRDIY_17115 [Chloroflexota bacterium]
MARLFFCVALVLSIAVLSISPALARTDPPTVSRFSATAGGAISSETVKAGRFDPAHRPASQPTPDTRIAPSHLTVSAIELGKRRASEAATMPRLDRALAPATKNAPIASLTAGASDASQPVSLVASAEGIDENALTNPYVPSDGAIASNGGSIVDAANDEIQTRAIWNGAVTGTWTFSSFFAPAFLNSDDANVQFSDPRVQWDSFGGRWLFVVDALDFATGQAWECVAASQTTDPTLPWWVSALDATVDGSIQTANISDYPMLGFDNQAVYISTNQFNWYTGAFAYSKVRVINKLGLETGSLSGWVDFTGMLNADGTPAMALQPAVNLTVPSAEYLLSAAPLGGSAISVWEVLNPLTAPTLRRATLAVSPYDVPIDATQPGGAQPLDPGDNRMQQVIQQNGILYGALTTAANFGYGVVDIPRLFTISPGYGVVALLADNYAGWANANGFYPSVSVDSSGDVMVVFLCSDSVTPASICEDSRAGTAPLTTMDPPLRVTAGGYSYVYDDPSGRNRWGDYSAIALDPNGTTFWTLGEYAAYPFNLWGTRVNALTYDPSSTGTTPTPTSTPVVTSTVTATATPTVTPVVTPTATATPAPSFHVYLPFVVSNQGP